MDLLSSILNAMDNPLAAVEKRNKLIKQQKKRAERLVNKKEEELLRFGKYVEERLDRFTNDDRDGIEFEPLDVSHRDVIDKIAGCRGLTCISFGVKNDVCYSVVYKKAPTEDEIAARNNGDGWNENVADEYAAKRMRRKELELEQIKLIRDFARNSARNHELNKENPKRPIKQGLSNKLKQTILKLQQGQKQQQQKRKATKSENDNVAKENAESLFKQKKHEFEEKRKSRVSAANEINSAQTTSRKRERSRSKNEREPEKTIKSDIKPTFNFKNKYAHLIGDEAALLAARKIDTNVRYGCVPSKNKKDIRTIEQTLSDIQAKKKRRLNNTHK